MVMVFKLFLIKKIHNMFSNLPLLFSSTFTCVAPFFVSFSDFIGAGLSDFSVDNRCWSIRLLLFSINMKKC